MDHDCLVAGTAVSALKSTRVASAGAGGACAGGGSGGNCGITWDCCTFRTASMFTLVDKFFCLVCSDVFDNLSLNALSAICLEMSKILVLARFILIILTWDMYDIHFLVSKQKICCNNRIKLDPVIIKL